MVQLPCEVNETVEELTLQMLGVFDVKETVSAEEAVAVSDALDELSIF